jgi:hypothetical protein
MAEDIKKTDVDFISKIKATIKDLWNGDIPLFKTFWLYHFAAQIVLSLLAGMIGLFGLVSVLWAGFMVKPIFGAASKYKGNKLYALLAKIAAVLVALGVIGRLLSGSL